MPSVRYENHYYPAGTEFTIPELGLVVNFETVEKDEIQVASFKAQGFEWPDNDQLVIVVKDPDPDEVVDELVEDNLKAELVKQAEDLGLEVPSGATKVEIAEMIAEKEAEGHVQTSESASLDLSGGGA